MHCIDRSYLFTNILVRLYLFISINLILNPSIMQGIIPDEESVMIN